MTAYSFNSTSTYCFISAYQQPFWFPDGETDAHEGLVTHSGTSDVGDQVGI